VLVGLLVAVGVATAALVTARLRRGSGT
jgi:hypothetical protein